MIVSAARKTLAQLFSAPFRTVFWKSIGLTIALFITIWFAAEAIVSTFLMPLIGPWPWLSTALIWFLGAGLIVIMGFLIAPVTSVLAGFFLDEIADTVETTHYPDDPPGKALPFGPSLSITLRFLGLVAIGNLIALLLVLVLGFGILIFFLLNGLLLGREYFQFAALRHHDPAEVWTMQQKFRTEIFIAGLLISAMLVVPIVNLLTPLFAGALMVHVHKDLQGRGRSDTNATR